MNILVVGSGGREFRRLPVNIIRQVALEADYCLTPG